MRYHLLTLLFLVAPGFCLTAEHEEYPRMGPETMKCMVRVINKESTFARMKAAMALGRSRVRSARAIKALRSMLKDKYAPARASAVFALGRSRSSKAIQAVAPMLEDRDALVRVEACRALAGLGADRQADMLPFSDPSPLVRTAALQAAAIIGKGSVEAKIAARFAVEDDPGVRAECVRTLRRLGADQGFAPARAGLADKDPEVRAQALLWLAEVPHAESAELCRMIARNCSNASAIVRRTAIKACGKAAGKDAEKLLRRCLRDKDHTVRKQAALVLGDVGTPACRPDLARMQQDQVREVRRAASLALVRHAEREDSSRSAIIDLAIAATSSGNPLVQREGLWMLGWMRSKKGFPAIMELAIRDYPAGKRKKPAGDPRLSAMVMWVISRTAYRPGGELAMKYLTCPDQALRVHAGKALEKIRYEPALDLLCKTVTKTQSVMGEVMFAYSGPERTNAVMALAAFSSEKALAALARVACSAKPLEEPDNLRIICAGLVRGKYTKGTPMMRNAVRNRLIAGTANAVILADAYRELTGKKLKLKAPKVNPYDTRFFITTEED